MICAVAGPIPWELGALGALQKLYLSRNQLSGKPQHVGINEQLEEESCVVDLPFEIPSRQELTRLRLSF